MWDEVQNDMYHAVLEFLLTAFLKCLTEMFLGPIMLSIYQSYFCAMIILLKIHLLLHDYLLFYQQNVAHGRKCVQ